MRAIHLIKKSVYMVTALIFYEINIEVSHKYTRLIFLYQPCGGLFSSLLQIH